MIILCFFFSRKTCSYVSRASQFLELDVSEFWQLFPTHMLSLESVLGFCHGIAKEGDCKVEFIQSFCWFYSMQKFFFFFFFGNLTIRYPVFRWDSCKDSVQNSVNKSCEWILRLASRQNGTRVKHAKGAKGSTSCCTTGQNFQFGQVVSFRLKFGTRSSRELE